VAYLDIKAEYDTVHRGGDAEGAMLRVLKALFELNPEPDPDPVRHAH
jgi:hypothetical protein